MENSPWLLGNCVVHEWNLPEKWNDGRSHLEYWNNRITTWNVGMME